jgi:hypothetical protein
VVVGLSILVELVVITIEIFFAKEHMLSLGFGPIGFFIL